MAKAESGKSWEVEVTGETWDVDKSWSWRAWNVMVRSLDVMPFKAGV